MSVDTVNAFIEYFESPVRNGDGGLSGLTFAAKDNFDLAGKVTGYGNPKWAETAGPAARNAEAVDILLNAGAALVGKTHLDDLAYSLLGMNAHYGTPVNSAAPDRVPGGSSSGSASAVAAGLVDFALGSDTGGSVRAPASFCGIYGLRPTHGRLPTAGLLGLAPSYDTTGLFTRDAGTMARVAAEYGIRALAEKPQGISLWAPQDLWAATDRETALALHPAIAALESHFGAARTDDLSCGPLGEWRETFRVCQAYEIWANLGGWIAREKVTFAPGVQERLDFARSLTSDDFATAHVVRTRLSTRLLDRLNEGAVMVIPTVPEPAPLLTTSTDELDRFRGRALTFLSAAGHAGCPQISIPAARVGGAPVGLSLIASPNKDELLLELALYAGLNRIVGS
jgi:amidase